jgi:hypothetical protein
VSAPRHAAAVKRAGVRDWEHYVAHRWHHGVVIKTFDVSGPYLACDAIILPTSRGVDSMCSGLTLAAQLAASHRCPLVVLVSGAAATTSGRAHACAIIAAGSHGVVDPVILDVSEVPPLALGFRADTSSLADRAWSGWAGTGDTALKRNVGILLAHRAGWKNILFLDDDILAVPRSSSIDGLTLDGENLGLVMGALEEGIHRAVGWVAIGVPGDPMRADNSVLCHIRRRMGYPQGVFLGGGAMAVRVDEDTAFFPRIYNEDWLFSLQTLTDFGHNCLAIAGEVTQDHPQTAFSDVRARMEEPGDILAEALMNLMHFVDRPLRLATLSSFWSEAVRHRALLARELQDVAARWPSPGAEVIDPSLIRALGATQAVHAELTRNTKAVAQQFREYVSLWLEDAVAWRRALRVAAEGRFPEPVQWALDSQAVELSLGLSPSTHAASPRGRVLTSQSGLASLFTTDGGGNGRRRRRASSRLRRPRITSQPRTAAPGSS